MPHSGQLAVGARDVVSTRMRSGSGSACVTSRPARIKGRRRRDNSARNNQEEFPVCIRHASPHHPVNREKLMRGLMSRRLYGVSPA
jgi:hypothetical protein